MKTTIDAGRVNIEKMRADMQKLQADVRWENRKFFLQALAAAAVCVGAGVALANHVNGKADPPPQVIYLTPGPAPAAPPIR